MARFEIGLLMLHGGTPRDRQSREELAVALPPGSEVGEPDDEAGAFSARVEADDLDEALRIVWDAVAASGGDDHLVFLEHPSLPDHWRSRSAKRGTLPGSLS